MANWDSVVEKIPNGGPVLIAGPTASGKSDLAITLAKTQERVIINADALQVYENWAILTARPTEQDCAKVPHFLYGHVPGTHTYSTGQWLREVVPLLDHKNPIIVGGTGLNFAALTEGLVDIPETPAEIRASAMERIKNQGVEQLARELDAETAARIDLNNPMRVQRAWEVLRATSRGLAEWQAETPPPILPLEQTTAFVICPDRDATRQRINDRFQAMMDQGLMDEVARNAPTFSPDLPSSKAIGSRELMAAYRGETPLNEAEEAVRTQTAQYAKRQRSWFRSRMKAWNWIDPGQI